MKISLRELRKVIEEAIDEVVLEDEEEDQLDEFSTTACIVGYTAPLGAGKRDDKGMKKASKPYKKNPK
jgi:hypothetical protein